MATGVIWRATPDCKVTECEQEEHSTLMINYVYGKLYVTSLDDGNQNDQVAYYRIY